MPFTLRRQRDPVQLYNWTAVRDTGELVHHPIQP